MPAWPKSFYAFSLSLRTAATEWKLRKKRAGPSDQKRALDAITPKLATASYWREVGVKPGMPYARFQGDAPLHSYAKLAPAIERMKAGENDVLWPGRCTLFALSAGIEDEQPRYIPMTEEILAHFRRAGLDALLYYTVRVRHAGVFRGRHLLLGGATTLAPVTAAAPHAAFAGELSGVVVLNLPAWAEKHLYEPGASTAKIPDWDARLAGIAAATHSKDITLVAGTPTATLLLANVVRSRTSTPGAIVQNLQARWPNLECCVHSGISSSPFMAELRGALGPGVALHEVYAATEGFIASQDSDRIDAGLRLMTDLGIFFEFLPLADWDEARVEHLGRKAVPLSEVKTGSDYVLVITTPGGLARYVLGDIVRFTSLEPPRLVYVGRTRLRLHSFGENVNDKDVTDVLVTICGRHKWSIVNFHVAPLLTSGSLTGQNRGKHEWWIELKPGTFETPTGPQIAAELDSELQRANADYAARRKSGGIESPVVRLVMPGVFEHWLRFHGRWGGQHKLARVRNDRLIADELAQITHFARD